MLLLAVALGLLACVLVGSYCWEQGRRQREEELRAPSHDLIRERDALRAALHLATRLLDPERPLDYPCAECSGYPAHVEPCDWLTAARNGRLLQ